MLTTSLIIALVLENLLIVMRWCYGKGPGKPYACPIHPEAVKNAPGRCEDCGLRLQLVEANSESAYK